MLKKIFIIFCVFLLVSVVVIAAKPTTSSTTTTSTTTTSSTTTTQRKPLTQFEKVQIYIKQAYNLDVTGYSLINKYQIDGQKFFYAEVYTLQGTYYWIISQEKALYIWSMIK